MPIHELTTLHVFYLIPNILSPSFSFVKFLCIVGKFLYGARKLQTFRIIRNVYLAVLRWWFCQWQIQQHLQPDFAREARQHFQAQKKLQILLIIVAVCHDCMPWWHAIAAAFYIYINVNLLQNEMYHKKMVGFVQRKYLRTVLGCVTHHFCRLSHHPLSR